MKYWVSQRVLQTLVYLVDDAVSEADAIAQVKHGQVPVHHEVDGDSLRMWASAQAFPYQEGDT